MSDDKAMFWRMFFATGCARISPGEWAMLGQEDREAAVEAGKSKRLEDIAALARAILEPEFLAAIAQLPEAFADFEEQANAVAMLGILRGELNARRGGQYGAQDYARSPDGQPPHLGGQRPGA